MKVGWMIEPISDYVMKLTAKIGHLPSVLGQDSSLLNSKQVQAVPSRCAATFCNPRTAKDQCCES